MSEETSDKYDRAKAVVQEMINAICKDLEGASSFIIETKIQDLRTLKKLESRIKYL